MNSENPYEAPRAQITYRPIAEKVSDRAPVLIVMGAYIGTVVSGSVFGLWGGPIGFVIGGMVAGIMGIFTFLPSLVVASIDAECKQRVAICCYASGAATGFLSVGWLFGFSDFSNQIVVLALIAAGAGAFGSFIGFQMSFSNGHSKKLEQLSQRDLDFDPRELSLLKDQVR